MSVNARRSADVVVTQSFEFSASHELRHLPMTHRCRRNHGHNYRITATVTHNGDGDVMSGLAVFEDYLRETFDHRLLNDRVAVHPTSELLARHLADWFCDAIDGAGARLISVEVAETPSSSARFDVATATTTISKTFRSRWYRDVTVTLGAPELDGYGFVTDLGDLAPFARHLEQPETLASLTSVGPACVSRLAAWFIDEVEPHVHGHLVAVRVVEGRGATGQWSRGAAA